MASKYNKQISFRVDDAVYAKLLALCGAGETPSVVVKRQMLSALASGDVSGDVSDISDVKSDDVSGDDVSGDDVSGDDVSGDDVSGDSIDITPTITFCKIGDRVEWRDMVKGKCEGVHGATVVSVAEGVAVTDTRQAISPKEWLESWFPVNPLTPPPNSTEIADSRIPAGDTQALVYDGKDRRQGATYAFGTTGVISPRNLTPGSLQWQLEQNQVLLEQCRQERTHSQHGLDAYDAECDRLTREKLAALAIGQFTVDAVGILEAGLEKVADISVVALQQKNAELAAAEIEKRELLEDRTQMRIALLERDSIAATNEEELQRLRSGLADQLGVIDALNSERTRSNDLAVLAATNNQELREKLESVERDKLAAIAAAAALEKQIEIANKENEELRDRVDKLLAVPAAGISLLSLPQLQVMQEHYLASLKGKETTIKTYEHTIKKFLRFLEESMGES